MLSSTPQVDALCRIPFFAGVEPATLERIAARMRSRQYRRGEVVFHHGDPGDALFVIVDGEVKISLPSDDGHEAIIAVLRPGDVFGELTLLDGAPRSVTATAIVPMTSVMLPRDTFRELIVTEPAVRDALLTVLAAEIRRLTVHVEDLHFLDMTGRLAAVLVRLAEERSEVGGGETLRVPATISQGDLAAMVGGTRQSVNKLLGRFAEDGLIRLDREGIVIRDLARLRIVARR